MEENGRRQLVLVPFPVQGHINPMLQLGAILHSKGFSITIAHAHYNFPNPFNHPNFTFIPLADGISNPNIFYEDFIAFLTTLNSNSGNSIQDSLNRMIQNQGPPCIIYDGLMYSVGTVARRLNLPNIILRTSSAANFRTYYVFPSLRDQGYLPVQDSMQSELVPGLHPLRFSDLPKHSFNLDNMLRFMAMLRDTQSSSGIIWNTMDWLEESSLAEIKKHCQIPIFPIGPMHKIGPPSSTSLLEEETSCIMWLDRQPANSVIYVSIGSLAKMDKNDVTEMALGLAGSSQPFLWVVRPGAIRGSSWDELLPDGFQAATKERAGCIVKWAPQKEVLAHPAVGGFWSHCGWNSTVESISEGVPMICRACFADQKVIARHVSHVWRVGVALENKLERREIEKVVRMLMVEKEGMEMRQRAMEFKEKAQLSIKKGGSSYNYLNQLLQLIESF